MAESLSDANADSDEGNKSVPSLATGSQSDIDCGVATATTVFDLECAVCLQSCVHPVQLPCGHIFCYLCVKGVANQSKRCAMCRKELPVDYLEHPNLVGGAVATEVFDDGNQWFYEGHNGWWQYDERTSAELEAAYKSGDGTEDGTCELLIAGFLYVIDFQSMVQFRRNDPSRRRRIKRDLVSIPKKGIAGLRVITSTNTSSTARPKSPSPVPVAPNNTPQTPHTPSQDSGTSSPTATPPRPSDSSLHRIVQDMENLLLLDSVDDDEESADDDLPPPHYPTFSEDLLD